MTHVFCRELRANLKGLLLWLAALTAFAAIGFFEYGGIAAADEGINALFDLMPRMVRVMFGMGALPIHTPEGYYVCMFFWLCLMTFTHASLLGATLLSKEERDKTAEFLFVRPLSRARVVQGKMLAGAVNVLFMALTAWAVTLWIFLPQTGGRTLAAGIHLSMLGMLACQLVFFSVGMLGAAALRTHQQATLFAAGFVVATYLISVLLEMAGTLDFLNFLSPFRYFYAVGVLERGLSLPYLLWSAALTAAAAALSVRRFSARDLRN